MKNKKNRKIFFWLKLKRTKYLFKHLVAHERSMSDAERE